MKLDSKEQDFRLSVVLLLPANPAWASRSIRHIRQQNFEGIQLVLLMRRDQELSSLNELLDGMAVKTVFVPSEWTAAESWAEGFRNADAPLVVLAEDHSFVLPGWAQAMWEAHQDDWYAVGPRVRNGNPGTSWSWADLALNFMEQVHSEPGPMVPLMGHNCCYKKTRLLEHSGDRLAEVLESESVLHSEWGREVCYHEPKAVVEHVNHSRWSTFLGHKILGGIVFGGLRCGPWPVWRRVVYAFGSPLIPLVRAIKISGSLRTMDEQERHFFQKVWPLIGLGLLLHGTGELLGYIFGSSVANLVYKRYSLAETNRWETVRKEERELCF